MLDGPTVQNHAEGFSEVVGFQLHATNGQMIVPVVAVLLLISSFFAKVSRAVVWALIVLLSVVVQVLLGLFELYPVPGRCRHLVTPPTWADPG